MKPKISIIIPCYNVQNYIEQCLDSIINQTYSNLEMICINDGSTDNTLDLLQKYERQDPRIKILNQQNKGLSESRNVGVDAAVGQYIMFVDSDDWIDESLITEVLTPDLEADLYCCSYNRVFRNKMLPRVLNLSGSCTAEHLQKRIVGLSGEELSDPSQADSIVTAWGKIYKTQIIKNNKIKFIDTKKIGTEDALFNIQYLNFAEKVYVKDKPLYFYRRSNVSSLTSNYKPRLFSQWKYLYNLIGQEISNKNIDFKEALNNRICLGVLNLSLNEMNNSSFVDRYKNIKLILRDEIYKDSFDHFRLNYLPLHWKMFYFLAKKKSTIGVYGMISFINIIQKFKNL